MRQKRLYFGVFMEPEEIIRAKYAKLKDALGEK
jgi:hypothetical protein